METETKTKSQKQNEYSRKWQKKNPEKRAILNKKYYEKKKNELEQLKLELAQLKNISV